MGVLVRTCHVKFVSVRRTRRKWKNVGSAPGSLSGRAGPIRARVLEQIQVRRLARGPAKAPARVRPRGRDARAPAARLPAARRARLAHPRGRERAPEQLRRSEPVRRAGAAHDRRAHAAARAAGARRRLLPTRDVRAIPRALPGAPARRRLAQSRRRLVPRLPPQLTCAHQLLHHRLVHRMLPFCSLFSLRRNYCTNTSQPLRSIEQYSRESVHNVH